MALTYTIVGLQAQCSAVATAIDGGNYTDAKAELAKARLILVGIPQEVVMGDMAVKMSKQIDGLESILNSLVDTATGDRRRLIRTGVSHG